LRMAESDHDDSVVVDARFGISCGADEATQHMKRAADARTTQARMPVLQGALCAMVFLNVAIAQRGEGTAPAQPIPFSHKVHAGTLKLQCKMCHPSPDPGETMTIASPSTCMQCHASVKTESPAIQKLAEAAKSGRPMAWVRIYRTPSYVSFSHRTHLEKANTCQ